MKITWVLCLLTLDRRVARKKWPAQKLTRSAYFFKCTFLGKGRTIKRNLLSWHYWYLKKRKKTENSMKQFSKSGTVKLSLRRKREFPLQRKSRNGNIFSFIITWSAYEQPIDMSYSFCFPPFKNTNSDRLKFDWRKPKTHAAEFLSGSRTYENRYKMKR